MKDTGFSVPAARSIGSRQLPVESRHRARELYDAAEGGHWSRPPAFPSGGGGLVSTVDDFLVFAQMLLDKGKHGGERILSRPSVEVMTTDHITPEQKAASDLGAGFFDRYGWGFGMAVVTRRDAVATVPGQYGWDGGLGTSWRSDPKEEMVGILMTQRAWESPVPPPGPRFGPGLSGIDD